MLEGKDNSGKPRQHYADRLAILDIDALRKETEDKIWLSAYANNNPRSDYHWHVTACYNEWASRGKPEEYAACYEAAKNSAG